MPHVPHAPSKVREGRGTHTPVEPPSSHTNGSAHSWTELHATLHTPSVVQVYGEHSVIPPSSAITRWPSQLLPGTHWPATQWSEPASAQSSFVVQDCLHVPASESHT
jgi:hypothetical protein